MGVGFGFAIAAQSLNPGKKIIMVVGDSAFGFSGMELETAARYNMPLKVIVINNNGIALGTDEIDPEGTPKDIPVQALSPTAQYELVSVAFGGKGKEVKQHDELRETLQTALTDDNMWVINCRIAPNAGKKAQSFSWLTVKDEQQEQKLPGQDAKL